MYITGLNKTETERLFNELVEHNVINSTSLLCPVCNINRYGSIPSLEHHLINNHRTMKCLKRKQQRMNYTCPTCNRVLIRNSKYDGHSHEVLKSSSRHRWKCKLCINTTTLNSIMHKLTHVQKVHKIFLNKCLKCFKSPWRTDKEYEKCSYCNKKLISTYLYRHCILHHLEEIPFCEYCKRYFINEESYAQHVRSNSSIRPFKGLVKRPCKVYGFKNKFIQVNYFSNESLVPKNL